MTTSNGTSAIRKSAGSKKIRILSYINLISTAETVENKKDTAIICAGSHMEFSVEDMLCAGLFIGRIADKENWQFNDQSFLAKSYVDMQFKSYPPHNDAIYELVSKGIHANRLFKLDSEKDVKFSCQFDLYCATASYDGKTIVLDKQ